MGSSKSKDSISNPVDFSVNGRVSPFTQKFINIDENGDIIVGSNRMRKSSAFSSASSNERKTESDRSSWDAQSFYSSRMTIAQYETLGADCLTEFIGSFFIGYLAATDILFGTLPIKGVAVSLAMLSLSYTADDITRSHYNPAYSLGNFIAGNITWQRLLAYTIAQLIGSIGGTMSCFGFTGKGGFIIREDDDVYADTAICFVEVFYTFLLCIGGMMSFRGELADWKNYRGITIGGAYCAGSLAAYDISGSIFNPALALALDIPGILADNPNENLYLYIAAPLFGAILSGLFLRFTMNFLNAEHIGMKIKNWREMRVIGFVEFFGSFTLVCSAGMSRGSPFITGLTLLVLMYTFFASYGSCFNPCISLARYFLGHINSLQTLFEIWFLQFAGATLGAFVSQRVTQVTMSITPGKDITEIHAFCTEVLISSFLIYIVLCIGKKQMGTESPASFGVVYASACISLTLSNGPCSGAIFNPAMAFGNMIVSILLGEENGFGQIWLYLIGPPLGGLLGLMCFKGVHGSAISYGIDI